MQWIIRMSLHAAVLYFAGDEEAAIGAEEPELQTPQEWSPLSWSRAANDDPVVLEAHEPEPLPVFHSGDSGFAWTPSKVS